MTSSNSSEPVTPTDGGAASVAGTGEETTVTTEATTTHGGESIADVIEAQKTKTTDAEATEAKATGEETAEGEETTSEAPTYEPDFKFKAYGKDYEVDEMYRSLITDPDSEKKVKDVFTKAYAFDDLKARHDTTQQQFEELSNEYQELDGDVRKVVTFLQNKDLDNVFASLGLTEEDVFSWTQKRLELQKLTPEQRQMVELQAQERNRAYELEQQNQSLQTQYQAHATQARAMQLDTVLSRPDISQAASAWDSRTGQIGSFRDLVIEEAQKAWYASQQDLSAEQAVAQVMHKYGKLLGEGATQPQAGHAPQAAPQTTQSPQVTQKPTIPVVQGRGTSPLKQAPKSLDDLRKMAKQYENANL